MYVRLTSQSCRVVVVLLCLALQAVWLPQLGAAVALDRDDDSQRNRCYEVTEELCGWVEFGTHDSAPRSGRPAAVDEAAVDEAAVGEVTVGDAGDALDATVGILACAVSSKAGVSVEQMIEPFVMVGPYMETSLDSIKQFQQWWDAAADADWECEASASDAITFDFLKVDTPMERRLDLLAALEPVDVQSLGPSVLVEGFEGFPTDPIAMSSQGPRRDVLVGCSAMIFTIEETYTAYDMSQRDVKLWSVFPTTTRPFCIRNRASDFDASPMWDQFDQVVQPETSPSRESVASQIKCSAYCLLDDWVVRWEDLTAEDSLVRKRLQPQAIGGRIAALLAQRNRLAGRAAMVLASRWREVKPEPRLSPVGAALLARAGIRGEPTGPMVDGVPDAMVVRVAKQPERPARR